MSLLFPKFDHQSKKIQKHQIQSKKFDCHRFPYLSGLNCIELKMTTARIFLLATIAFGMTFAVRLSYATGGHAGHGGYAGLSQSAVSQRQAGATSYNQAQGYNQQSALVQQRRAQQGLSGLSGLFGQVGGGATAYSQRVERAQGQARQYGSTVQDRGVVSQRRRAQQGLAGLSASTSGASYDRSHNQLDAVRGSDFQRAYSRNNVDASQTQQQGLYGAAASTARAHDIADVQESGRDYQRSTVDQAVERSAADDRTANLYGQAARTQGTYRSRNNQANVAARDRTRAYRTSKGHANQQQQVGLSGQVAAVDQAQVDASGFDQEKSYRANTLQESTDVSEGAAQTQGLNGLSGQQARTTRQVRRAESVAQDSKVHQSQTVSRSTRGVNQAVRPTAAIVYAH